MDKKKRLLFSVIIGNTIEWLEFTLFAYLSYKISPHFFPEDMPSAALLKTYMIFGTSYFTRPFGSLVFGYLGDKLGRVFVLRHSLIIMSIATASMALIPSYEQIGPLSPLLLVCLRILQGLSVSGEFTSSQLVLIEGFGKKNPFSYGTLGPLSASLGMVLGGLMAGLVYAEFLPESAWRVAFLASSLLGFVGVYLRHNLPEPAAFRKMLKENKLEKNPPFAALVKSPFAFSLCFFTSMFISNFVYLGSFFFERLAFASTQLPKGEIHNRVILGQIIASLVMLMGFFAMKRVPPKPYTILTLIAAVLLSPVMMHLATVPNLKVIFLGQILYGLINGLASSTLLTLVSLEFPPQTRMSGTSFAWSLGASLFGGTSLFLGELLFSKGLTPMIGLYISLSAFLCLVFVAQTKRIT